MMHDAIFVVPPRLGGPNALFFLPRKNEISGSDVEDLTFIGLPSTYYKCYD